jgi:hypothetical protein
VLRLLFQKIDQLRAVEAQETEGDQAKDLKPRLVARTSWVFNAEQVDGWTAPEPANRSEVEVREHVEAFSAACAPLY